MAKALPLPTMDALAGVDARHQALDKLEELVNEVVREKARHRSNIFLKRSIRSWRRGDIVKSGQWALKATEADDSNSKAFHVLAMALERMGHLHKALVTYERAFELDPEDPELLINLGLTAWNLKLTEGAAHMFRLYIAACPESALGYNNIYPTSGPLGSVQQTGRRAVHSAGRRLVRRADGSTRRFQPRVNFQGAQHDLRIDAAVAREIGQLPLDDSFQLDDPVLLAVLETLVGFDADDVSEIDELAGELDPHDVPREKWVDGPSVAMGEAARKYLTNQP